MAMNSELGGGGVVRTHAVFWRAEHLLHGDLFDKFCRADLCVSQKWSVQVGVEHHVQSRWSQFDGDQPAFARFPVAFKTTASVRRRCVKYIDLNFGSSGTFDLLNQLEP